MEKSKLRIAIISVFYPYRGGIAQFNANMFRGLEACGHEVKAFNFSRQYPSLLFPGKTQYVTDEDDADELPSSRTLDAVSPYSYFKTYKAVEAFAPDLVIIGYWMPFMAPSLGFLAKKLGKNRNVIAVVHNALPHERSKVDKLLGSYFFKHVNQIVALSESVKESILSSYPEKDIVTLPHPAYAHFGNLIKKEDAITQLGIPPNKRYLLFFGLVRPYKGVAVLLEAMAYLPPDFHLIIAGEVYGSFSEYDAIIQRHQIQERVHLFNSYIPDQRVKVFFSAADLVVLPYKSATQSGIVAIAQHLGVPVIASNVGGLHEFIQNDETGMLVDHPTPERFAKQIRYCANEEWLTRIKDNMHKKSRSITWNDFAEKLIQFSLMFKSR